jgi:drug/metabolite transporter (DMT)-like permease
METRPMLTSQSVAAMIISGVVLIFLGIFGGGHADVIGLGAALLLGAGLFQTIDNRRATR